MEFDVAVLPGDGVGPEVVAEALKVLQTLGERFGHSFRLYDGLIGGVAIDAGGSKWDDPQAKIHPEDGLLALRKELGLFANLRPVKVLPMLVDSTNLKPEVVKGVDLMVVRELTGGLYFGQPKKQWQTPEGRQAVDTMAYSEVEIERILRVGFEVARSRRKKLTSVDKANVLQSSRLWRQIAQEISCDYPDVEIQHMLVDACAMRFIQRPTELDVLVTGNMFGDILTDEASMLAGSMGMLPSASLAGIPKGKTFGMYEPIHGSAPSRAYLERSYDASLFFCPGN